MGRFINRYTHLRDQEIAAGSEHNYVRKQAIRVSLDALLAGTPAKHCDVQTLGGIRTYPVVTDSDGQQYAIVDGVPCLVKRAAGTLTLQGNIYV